MGLKIVLENFESADPRQITRVINMLQTLLVKDVPMTGALDTCVNHAKVTPFGSLVSSPVVKENWAPYVDIIDPKTPVEASAAPEVPIVPPAPPVPPTPISGIEVDDAGYPWDGRIHASSRAKTTDGAWRKRRGVDDVMVAAIEAQLKQTMTIPAPAAVSNVPPFPSIIPTLIAPVAPPPPPSVVVAPPPPFASNAALPAGLANGTPEVSAGVAPTAFPSNSAVVTFPALMQKITAAFQQEVDKTAFQARIQDAIQSVGLPSLPMLASRQDLVAAVATRLGLAL
jgi:hypothetical protein